MQGVTLPDLEKKSLYRGFWCSGQRTTGSSRLFRSDGLCGQGGRRPLNLFFRRPIRCSPQHPIQEKRVFHGPVRVSLTSSLYLIYLNSSSSKQGTFLWISHFFLFKSNTYHTSNLVGRGLGISGLAGDNWDRCAAAVDKPRVVLALSPGFSAAF